MNLQWEERLKNDLDYEHEVLIEEKSGVQLSEKSLTDNSKVYNVYITRGNGEAFVAFAPANRRDANQLFKALVKYGPGEEP